VSRFSSPLNKHRSVQLSTPYRERTTDQRSDSTMGDVMSVIYDKEKTSLGEIAIMVKTEDGTKVASTALPFNPYNFMTPVPNERVHLIKDPVDDQFYYTGIVPPSVYRGEINYMLNSQARTFEKGTSTIHTGNIFKPRPNTVRSLDVYEGDYTIQGRYGSTIRFAGTNEKIPNGFQHSSENVATPIILIRNGYMHTEDIEVDEASIYLTSNQHIQVPFKAPFPSELESSRVKYSKAQIILHSDRLCLASRNDDIILNSNKSIQLLTKSWAHDVDKVLDSFSELVTEVKSIAATVKSLSLTSISQTFIVPGIGTTALSTKVPDWNNYYSKSIAIEQNVNNIEQKIMQLKQK
tara:strand:+ start:2154 stop:3203 length:1050 start_codon:yes stop_codon:yes gene_type:complete